MEEKRGKRRRKEEGNRGRKRRRGITKGSRMK